MNTVMAELRRRLPRTRCDLDRHGNERWYALDPYGQKVRLNPKKLKIEIGSDAFMARYQAAIAGDLSKRPAGTNKLVPGSIGELINIYLNDPNSAFNTKLNERSKYVQKGRLLAIQREHGNRSAEGLTEAAVESGRNSRSDKPWSANNRILALKALYKYGLKVKFVSHNPAKEVEKLKTQSDGYHTWTPEEVKKFEARWDLGTPARLAFDLLLYTGQRRGDVIRMGPQHVTPEGRMLIKQCKTGKKLEIQIVKPLADSIAAFPRKNLTYVVTEYGKPFTDNGFGNRFRKWCDDAGLPHCTAHGLRKALASRLAELGMTAIQIAAVTGHSSLKEVQRYIDKADQKRMADTAMRTFEAQIVPLSDAHFQEVGGNSK
jgi:integrase